MTFQLVHKGNTAANAVFHVLDEKDTVVGSVNVPPSQAADLLRHWRGANTPGTPARTRPQRPRAKLKLPPLNRAAILRGR